MPIFFMPSRIKKQLIMTKGKKFSKTEHVKKPFKAKKKLYQRMEKHLDATIDKVISLAKELECAYKVDIERN